jgi:acyl-CoA thioesterase-1
MTEQSEDFRLIAQLREVEDLRLETREELGWIEEDIRKGDASRADLDYLRKLGAELLGGAVEAAPRSGKVIRVCFVGDSITNGTGDESFLGWPARVANAAWEAGHDVTCYSLGVRADTSEQIAARWRGECESRLIPELAGAVVFSFGLNDSADKDGARRVPLERSIAVARAMVGEAKARWPVLWVGPTPIDDARQPVKGATGAKFDLRNERIAEYSEAYRDLAIELAVPYLELAKPLIADEAFMASMASGDALHPTRRGYEIIAERVTAWAGWQGLLKSK